MNVRDLDIDMIDRINPFEAAYAILAKTLSEKTPQVSGTDAALNRQGPRITPRMDAEQFATTYQVAARP